jgi:mannose/fructose-specific phosphotransferase system component IIA
MINILLVTHGDLGKELLKSSELIIGKVENAESILHCLYTAILYISELYEIYIKNQ